MNLPVEFATHILALLLGVYIGHRFSFNRDIHKEWRSARDPILQLLHNQSIDPVTSATIDFEALAWRINWPWRRYFDSLVASYNHAMQDKDNQKYADFHSSFKNANNVRVPATKLLRYLHWM